jgi:hypothetical protein
VKNKWEGELSFEVTPYLDYETYPESHHASSVFAYHHESKTVHIDDTMTYFDTTPPALWLAGARANILNLRFDLAALLKKNTNPDATKLFGVWFREKICKWDIENAVIAHNGVLKGGAKKQFDKCLEFFSKYE